MNASSASQATRNKSRMHNTCCNSVSSSSQREVTTKLQQNKGPCPSSPHRVSLFIILLVPPNLLIIRLARSYRLHHSAPLSLCIFRLSLFRVVVENRIFTDAVRKAALVFIPWPTSHKQTKQTH
eukprot:GHVL01004750.1.p1 GENE.GHVL01004750.1~~GHVL01004750.1.p1  ORF type:complete len:124 (+),score=5.72 GHVL01004750.1:50-421(+)